MAPPFIVLGCGYIGSRAARTALAMGRTVRVCSRHPAKLEPLRLAGAEVRPFDAARVRSFGPALEGTRGATVLYAVPPVTEIPLGEALARATEAALHVGARTFIFVGSAGLYGDMPEETWVDEETPTVHDDALMSSYHTDESAVMSASFAGLRTVTLRLAAVYGPGRGVRVRLLGGDYKLLDGGKHANSRIHIDDLVGVILAAEKRAQQGSMYMVADDKPTTQGEYAQWLCERLDLPPPPTVASYAPGMRRTPHRGRFIRNDKLKKDLQYTFRYPSYVEGEAAIEEEARTGIPVYIAGAAPAASAAAVAPAAPAAAVAPAAAIAATTTPAAAGAAAAAAIAAAAPASTADRPPFVMAASAVKSHSWSYPSSTETHGQMRDLAEAVGLDRWGMNLIELAPGERSGYPHAHANEEEFLFVLEGTPDLWIDGHLHRLGPGDIAGFPAGTGISHILMNNSAQPVRFLSGGENRKGDDKVSYPVNPERLATMKQGRAWTDAPKRELGPHDGKPRKP